MRPIVGVLAGISVGCWGRDVWWCIVRVVHVRYMSVILLLAATAIAEGRGKAEQRKDD